MNYQCDSLWKEIQRYLPLEYRILQSAQPQEYFIPMQKTQMHKDHYKCEKPKATIILFRGVGGNGRLLSFIAVPLNRNSYEVICAI